MQKKHLIHLTYILGFFVYLHGYLVIYVNSSFLATFTSEETVGLIFTAASLLAMLCFFIAPYILRGFGNFKATLLFILIEIIVLLALAFLKSPILLIISFLLYNILYRFINFDTDVFLEATSDDSETGSTRGIFLTMSNIALVLSPLAVGLILRDGTNYEIMYILSAIVLLPALVLLIIGFKNFKDPHYEHISLKKSIIRVWKNKDLYKIFSVNFVLRFFYSWMTIYTPLYLHEHIGMPWSEIGIIFTIMLLPFALFEYPLGWLADKKYGEKEILSLGFIFMALMTILLSFIGSSSVIVWAAALFGTRIGASMIEIMTETYFFKKIDGSNSDLLGFFRMIEPFAYVVGPLVASVALVFVDIRYLFVLLGIIMLFGLRYSLTLRDTL